MIAVQVPAYILAGGRSSRFGSDKARALVDGQPLIVRIARSIEPTASPITVVAARANAYVDLGLRTIADLYPGAGPLAGLQASLMDCEAPWILMLSCDLLEVQPQWIELLLKRRIDQAAAVAYRHTFWEPLMALYHRRLLPQVEHRLRSGQLRMQTLLDEVHAVAVDPPPDWPARIQANSPEDLKRIRRVQS